MPLDALVAKDAKRVYLQDSELATETALDVASFEHVGGSYYRDANAIYCIWYSYDGYDCDPVDCDRDSFRVVGGAFAADDSHVYNHGAIAEGVDPASFELLSPYFAHDANDVYFLHFGGKNTDFISLEKLGADPKSFRLLDDRYARDDSSVFFYFNCESIARRRFLLIDCRRVEVDPERFQPLDRASEDWGPDGTDGDSLFFLGRRLPFGDPDDREAFEAWLAEHGAEIFPEGWGFESDAAPVEPAPVVSSDDDIPF